MQNQSQEYYTPIQLKMPVEMERITEVDDPVYSFSEVLCHIDLKNILGQYAILIALEPEKVVRGRGHRKSAALRLYDQLAESVERLKKYAKHIEICGGKERQLFQNRPGCDIHADKAGSYGQ